VIGEKEGNEPWHYFTEIISRDSLNDYKEIIRRMQKDSTE
jgi:hypothetical protein